MRAPIIEVAASIVRAPDGRVLMAERTRKQLSPGFWELPGGKIEPGESAREAAIRELEEEIGIRALSIAPWIQYEHPFRVRRLRLHFFKVDQWVGTPYGREGQRLAWIDPASPAVAPILSSVQRLLDALGLPPLYAVYRSGDYGDVSAMIEHMTVGVRQGLRLLQLHAPDFAPDQRVALARRMNAIVAPSGARVLLVGSALEARRAGLAGLHTTAADLRRLTSRPPVQLWLCSCHDDADLARAIQLGADAAVVSPVLTSAAHLDRVPLGWEGLKRLSAKAPLPLYAQGGIDASHLRTAQDAGGVGIATARWDTTFNAQERDGSADLGLVPGSLQRFSGGLGAAPRSSPVAANARVRNS